MSSLLRTRRTLGNLGPGVLRAVRGCRVCLSPPAAVAVAVAVVEAALIAFRPMTIVTIAFPRSSLPSIAFPAIAIVMVHPVARRPSPFVPEGRVVPGLPVGTVDVERCGRNDNRPSKLD